MLRRRVGRRPKVVSTCVNDLEVETHSNIETGIARKESDSTHEVLRSAHLANRDERCPLLLELRVVVQNFLGSKLVRSCNAKKTCDIYSAVSMYPGEMQLTRMPAPAHSTARLDAK
jgi:hypothetical protein